MSDSNFDKMLGKLRKFKDELEKAKVEVNLGTPAKKGKTATNEYVDAGPKFKKDGKWKETKKAEFLAMTKSGQWALEPLEKGVNCADMGKGEEQRKDNDRGKDKKGKHVEPISEKEVARNAPSSEPYAGSSKDRMGKAEECHEDDPHHEAKEVKIADDIKSKAKKLKDMHKMDDATTLQGPISATVATKDEGAMSGDYHATGIEKKDSKKK